ncbi:MAG: hypothetical protein CMP57_03945 [Flavobacteriales bacterium]|nr:hypothetical protein [Flavobacteriales bacterium]|tara:strand:- start:6650 stop:6967 length:318 start_codon:yes stop_codon:yes gene_type:complete
MSENAIILEKLVEQVNTKTDKEVQVFLSMDNSQKEFLTFKTKKHERGIPLDEIVHAFGRFRMYGKDSEEEALDALTTEVGKSIASQLEQLVKEETKKSEEGESKE